MGSALPADARLKGHLILLLAMSSDLTPPNRCLLDLSLCQYLLSGTLRLSFLIIPMSNFTPEQIADNPLLEFPEKYPFAHYPNALRLGEKGDGVKISPKTGKIIPRNLKPNLGFEDTPRNPFGYKGDVEKEGTPAWKEKTFRDAVAICEKMNVNPFELLLAIASNNKEYLKLPEEGDVSVANRLKAASEATKYIMATMKSIEIKDNTESKTKTIVVLPSNGREASSILETGEQAALAHIADGISPKVFEIPIVTQEELQELADEDEE